MKKYIECMEFLVYRIYSPDLLKLIAQFEKENDAISFIDSIKKSSDYQYLLLNNETGEESIM